MNFNVPLLRDGVRRLVHPDLYRKRMQTIRENIGAGSSE
jgi:hypothetical protein